MDPITQLAVGFTLQIVGFFLQSAAAKKEAEKNKPKRSQFKEPVAEPGRTMSIIAGTVLIEDPQILLATERSTPRRWVRMKPK